LLSWVLLNVIVIFVPKIFTFLFFFLVFSQPIVAQKEDSLLSAFNTAKNDSLKAVILNQLWKQERDSDLEKATYYAKQALQIARDNNLKNQEAISLKNLGIGHWLQNNLDSALMRYNESLALFILIDDKKEIARLYNNISVVFNRKEQKDTAIALLQTALDINLQRNDSNGISMNYINLAVLYGDLKNSSQELFYEKQALKYVVDSKRDLLIANIGASMSTIYGPDSAIFYYRKALQITTNDWLKERIYLNMGSNFLVLEKVDSASLYLELAKNLIHDKKGRNYVKALMDQGGLYFYKKEYARSLFYYKQSIKIAEEQEYQGMVVELRNAISNVYAAMHKWQLAYNWMNLYVQLNDSLTNLENSKHLADLQAKFDFEKRERAIGNLTKENLLKEIEIGEEKKVKLLMLVFIGFILMVFIISFLAYKRRQEKKSHKLALKKMEIEQRMLRSQMNPHFIFNALNSIQSYISTNSTYEAEVFLSKFSLLVRNILENSTYEFIDLDKEVETLKLYLELEKLRFNDKFNYSIEVELSDSSIQIPPMLVQPFVENAIIHGMKGKDGNGKIDIRFAEAEAEEELILCQVIDNGVGRNNSKEKQENHKSLSTTLTNDRIQLFNQERGDKFRISITDLEDKEGKALGTKVELLIPFIF
jgi:tetratricopeptide (TPR) repeat protein